MKINQKEVFGCIINLLVNIEAKQTANTELMIKLLCNDQDHANALAEEYNLTYRGFAKATYSDLFQSYASLGIDDILNDE